MTAFISRHKTAVAVAAVTGIGLIVFVLLFFEPQALFIDEKVDEALPTVAPTASQTSKPDRGERRKRLPKTLAEGTFRGLDHSASGKALFVKLADGSRVLRFEDFDVQNGPDLKVYLSSAPASSEQGVFDDDIIDLGDLKGNIGNQNYKLPTGTDIDRYSSAVIWCKRFGVGFAVAGLQ